MNDEYESKLFTESALRLISDSISGKEVCYSENMGLAELEMRTREAGTGVFHKYLAHGLYRLCAEPEHEYELPFIMRLSSQKIVMRLIFRISSSDYSVSVSVRKIERDGEEMPLPSKRTVSFGADLFESANEGGERMLSFTGGTYT